MLHTLSNSKILATLPKGRFGLATCPDFVTSTTLHSVPFLRIKNSILYFKSLLFDEQIKNYFFFKFIASTLYLVLFTILYAKRDATPAGPFVDGIIFAE